MPLVCGVDESTQSTKVEIRDADDGRLIARGSAPHPPTTPPRSEQDPESWWRALAAALRAAGQLDDIAAISVAGQQHGMVVLDDDGAVIRPAKLWNDTESAPDAAALVERIDHEAWARACGSLPVAAFTITKLAWLRRVEPANFARIAHVLLPHDWLTYRLTGNFVTDRGDASGTGYWSPRDDAWAPQLLALVDDTRDWTPALPRVLAPHEPAGVLTAEAASALGLRAGIPVACGTGDNMAAALALALNPGDLAISIGTSGTAYTVCDAPTADATGAVAGFADATGRFLPLVCTLNGTKVMDAIARLLGVSHEEFDALASSARDANDPVLLPYFDGERTPNRPDARGVLAGITSDISREALARAAVTGVACGLIDAVDALTAAGVPLTNDPAWLIGGGAKSRAMQAAIASLLGHPVRVATDDEHVARGAAIQAAAIFTNAHPAAVAAAWGPPDSTTVEPQRSSANRATIRQRYAALRDTGTLEKAGAPTS